MELPEVLILLKFFFFFKVAEMIGFIKFSLAKLFIGPRKLYMVTKPILHIAAKFIV